MAEREVVYIAGKYTDKDPKKVQFNVDMAVAAGATLLAEGKAPFIPHANFHDIAQCCRLSYKDYLRADLAILKRCDSIFMMRNWQESRGAKIEHWLARRWHKKIYYEDSWETDNGILEMTSGEFENLLGGDNK